MSIPIREATETDMRFVIKSWADSMRDSLDAGHVSTEDWYDIMPTVYRKITEREGCHVLVAWIPGVTEGIADVVAWLCYERGFSVPVRVRDRGRTRKKWVQPDAPLIHYALTKRNARGDGLQRMLLREAGIDTAQSFYYSCKPKTLTMSKLPRHAIYDSKICRYPKERKNGKRNQTNKA